MSKSADRTPLIHRPNRRPRVSKEWSEDHIMNSLLLHGTCVVRPFGTKGGFLPNPSAVKAVSERLLSARYA